MPGALLAEPPPRVWPGAHVPGPLSDQHTGTTGPADISCRLCGPGQRITSASRPDTRHSLNLAQTAGLAPVIEPARWARARQRRQRDRARGAPISI